jgi:cell division protein FtsB
VNLKFAHSRGRLIFIACSLVAVYFVYTAAIGAYRAHQVSGDVQEAQAKTRELEAKKDYLEAIKEYVASDAYVEQEARRTLGFIRAGEVPFVVLSPAPLEQPEGDGPDWWQRLFPK